MSRHAAIFLMIICLLCGSGEIFAADFSIENMLPSEKCTENWVAMGKVTLYTKDTLFDHINGEAELYFPYGFEVLATATYMNRSNPEEWVVADVYRMGSLLNAFGIYSNYRRSDAVSIAVGAEGFVSPSQLMFYQDRYFVRLQVTGTTSLKQDIFRACAQTISQNLPFNASRPRELSFFRIPGVVSNSERYIAQSLLGYAFFQRGMIADVILEGKRIQVFIVPEESRDNSLKTFDNYFSYLKVEGQGVNVIKTPNRISLKAIDPLYGGVFVEQYGRYIIGAIRLKEPDTAKGLIQQVRRLLD
ncbi:MAG: DUF6599 family protein [Syntrophaceae bacterium]